MELAAATESFLSDRAHRGCNPLTVRWYRDVLGLFLRDCGTTSLEAVTLTVLRAYIVRLQTSGHGKRNTRMSAVTIRKRVLALKTFFLWATSVSLIDHNPCAELIAPRAPRRLPRAMSIDQASDFMKVNMSARDRAIVSLMLDTGIRLSECCALDVSDVDENQGTVLIRVGKGMKQRMVVFESEAREALGLWLCARSKAKVRDATALFLAERTGKRLTRYGMYKAVKRIAAVAGLDAEASPHKIRHTMASLYLDAGGAIQDLSQLMGHTEVSTTWIYTKIAVGGLRKKHTIASPLKQLH